MVDVGCGIGGSSRHIARKFGCTAKGITLSPVQVGLYLTLLVTLRAPWPKSGGWPQLAAAVHSSQHKPVLLPGQ